MNLPILCQRQWQLRKTEGFRALPRSSIAGELMEKQGGNGGMFTKFTIFVTLTYLTI